MERQILRLGSHQLVARVRAHFSTSARKEVKQFAHLVFDENGRYLLLHHHSAQKYYKWNVLFVGLFYAFSFYNAKAHPELFFN